MNLLLPVWAIMALALGAVPTAAPNAAQSVGHPFTGRLEGGVPMPARGPGFALRGPTTRHGWRYALPDLVRGIEWTAERLQEAGGAPLVVGNLSRKGGGDLPCSRSHNTGRDVDLGLYTMDARGRAVPSEYYRFDAHGRSLEAGGRWRFDVAANWRLVRSLLTNPHFDVQWLVLNEHLERLLLDHARSLGEPAELVTRAEQVIDRPAYANLHRNHLHVRILCPPDQARCEQAGPVWSWVAHRVAGR